MLWHVSTLVDFFLLVCRSLCISGTSFNVSTCMQVLSHVVSLPVMPKDGQVSGNAWMDDDDSDVLMGDDGMEYCPVPDDLLDVVPEESISDDEIDSSLSMVPEAPTSAEEDKRGDVVLPCEDSFLQPQKRMELYNDAQWRMKASCICL